MLRVATRACRSRLGCDRPMVFQATNRARHLEEARLAGNDAPIADCCAISGATTTAQRPQTATFAITCAGDEAGPRLDAGSLIPPTGGVVDITRSPPISVASAPYSSGTEHVGRREGRVAAMAARKEICFMAIPAVRHCGLKCDVLEVGTSFGSALRRARTARERPNSLVSYSSNAVISNDVPAIVRTHRPTTRHPRFPKR